MHYNIDAEIFLTEASHAAYRRRGERSEDRRSSSVAVVIPLDKAAYQARYQSKIDPPMRGLLVGVLAGAYIWMVVAGLVALAI